MEKDSSLLVSVLSYETGFDNGKETTFFIIHVNVNGHDFNIKKRFKKFDELHERLGKVHANLPELPAKSLLKITKVVELEKRRVALERYLKVVKAHAGPCWAQGHILELDLP
jgi:hypothetical protein